VVVASEPYHQRSNILADPNVITEFPAFSLSWGPASPRDGFALPVADPGLALEIYRTAQRQPGVGLVAAGPPVDHAPFLRRLGMLNS